MPEESGVELAFGACFPAGVAGYFVQSFDAVDVYHSDSGPSGTCGAVVPRGADSCVCHGIVGCV